MKKILAFGDSNTWGLIPGTSPYERYPRGVRWTSLLQDKLDDVKVVEEGLCGRTTVYEDADRPGRKGISAIPELLESNYPVDFVILMLGTNDCKSCYDLSADTIGKGISSCLDILGNYVSEDKILLVSPIALGEDVWKPDKDPAFSKKSVVVSRQLKDVYKAVAKERNVNFLAAADYVKASPVDNEHMDVESHRRFANVVFEKIKDIY